MSNDILEKLTKFPAQTFVGSGVTVADMAREIVALRGALVEKTKECETLNVLFKRSQAHEAFDHNQRRDVEAERDSLRDGIVMALRVMTGDPDGNVPAGKEIEVLQSWVDGWMEKADAALEANEALREGLEKKDKELSALVENLVLLFGWEDKSALHAILHVKNAVFNERADKSVAEHELRILREEHEQVKIASKDFECALGMLANKVRRKAEDPGVREYADKCADLIRRKGTSSILRGNGDIATEGDKP